MSARPSVCSEGGGGGRSAGFRTKGLLSWGSRHTHELVYMVQRCRDCRQEKKKERKENRKKEGAGSIYHPGDLSRVHSS